VQGRAVASVTKAVCVVQPQEACRLQHPAGEIGVKEALDNGKSNNPLVTATGICGGGQFASIHHPEQLISPQENIAWIVILDENVATASTRYPLMLNSSARQA
jgi:hypothetical protein